MIIIIIIIWLILGLHSCWFLIKRFCQYYDFTMNNFYMLIICIIVPIISHIATIVTFPKIKKVKKLKILFHKSQL